MYDTIISPAARPRSAPEGRPPVPQRADNHAPPLASVNERPVKEEAPAWPRVSTGNGGFV